MPSSKPLGGASRIAPINPVAKAAPKPAPKPAAPGVTPAMQSAGDFIKQTLHAWGMDGLYDEAWGMITQGYTPDQITIHLQQTDAYHKRFAGNDLRVKQGLHPLQPAEYIGLEEQYRNVLANHGLPSGFYDSKRDFDNWIAKDVSPSELDERAKVAADQYQDAAPEDRAVWEGYYGLTPGHAIAWMLDPNHTTLQNLKNIGNTVGIGAAGAKNGIWVDKNRAELFTQNHVTLEGARQAYQNIGQHLAAQQGIASRFGYDPNAAQTLMENDELLHRGQDSAILQSMNAQEESLYGGKGAASSQSNSLDAAGAY